MEHTHRFFEKEPGSFICSSADCSATIRVSGSHIFLSGGMFHAEDLAAPIKLAGDRNLMIGQSVDATTVVVDK